MCPDLQRLHKELERALSGLNAVQTQLRPRSKPECWTIQQIAEHLRLTYASTARVIVERTAKATPTRAQPTLRQRLAQLSVLTVGYLPTGRKAPVPVTPAAQAPALTGDQILAAVTAELTSMDSACTRASTLFGPSRRAITHMILGPLSIRQWSRFHLVHGRHHLRQIATIRHQQGV